MKTSEIINKLLLMRYYSNITVARDSDSNGNICIADTRSGTLFTMSNNFYFSFKDENDNTWLTIPKTFVINDKQYYPKIGDKVTYDGKTLSFTTKEEVIKMATEYFEKYENLFYGLDYEGSLHFFHEWINGKNLNFQLVEHKFRSCTHKNLPFYISFN